MQLRKKEKGNNQYKKDIINSKDIQNIDVIDSISVTFSIMHHTFYLASVLESMTGNQIKSFSLITT